MAAKIQDEVYQTQRFGIFMQRILLCTMLIVFAAWLVLKLLPSHFTADNLLPSVKSLTDEQSMQKLRIVFILIEAAFSCSLLVCVFIPASRLWLIIHFITALLLLAAFWISFKNINIPFFAYILLLGCCFFQNKDFDDMLNFFLTLSILLLLFYAYAYFIRWRQYLANPFFVKMMMTNNMLNQTTAGVMPWFYFSFLIFCIRFFIRKYNLILFFLMLVLLLIHFYFNAVYDVCVIFFLFPYINWQKVFLKFNRRFQPK